MKKLPLLLIVILAGVLLINTLPSPSTAQEPAFGSMLQLVTFMNDSLKSFTIEEMDEFERRVTQDDLDKATILMDQFAALCRLGKVIGNIIAER